MNLFGPTKPKKPLHVAFDEQCGLCMSTARTVKALDWHQQVVVDSAYEPHHDKLKVLFDRLLCCRYGMKRSKISATTSSLLF